jgi:hypothetical protein
VQLSRVLQQSLCSNLLLFSVYIRALIHGFEIYMDSDLGLDPTLVWEIVEQKPPISLNVNPYVKKKLCTQDFEIVLEWDMHVQALYIGP